MKLKHQELKSAKEERVVLLRELHLCERSLDEVKLTKAAHFRYVESCIGTNTCFTRKLHKECKKLFRAEIEEREETTKFNFASYEFHKKENLIETIISEIEQITKSLTEL